MADLQNLSGALAAGEIPQPNLGADGTTSASQAEDKKTKQVKRSWADQVESVLSKKPNNLNNQPKFLIITSEQNQLSNMSPFFIQKGLKGIGGDPKSVKKLRSGDLLIETSTPLQSKSFLLAKSIANIPITVTPHRTLNFSRGVISEFDLVNVSESEITAELSDQGVTECRRITIKKGSEIISTKHIILTFNTPSIPSHITAGYLKCSVRPYIPNPLRCFNCQRFGHSKNSCRGQETCSRCATVGHSFTDCQLDPKCVNCLGPHTSNSRNCPNWKQEKQIQTIKCTQNISYPDARKQVLSSQPISGKSYAAAVSKPQLISTAVQTEITYPSEKPVLTNTQNPRENKGKTHNAISKVNASTSTDLPTKPKVIKEKNSTANKTQFKNKNKGIQYLIKKPEYCNTSAISDSSDSGEMEIEAGMETPPHLARKSTKPKLQRPPKAQ